VSKWIEGIEVIPDAAGAANFWPTASNSFDLPFSRNLNCIIGGRGSGKSSVIEAIGFLTKPEDYQLTPPQREASDYYKRAKATLQGCKIKLCWKSNSKDGESSIPAGGLFVSRYFDPKDNHKESEITGKDDKSIPSPTIPSVQLYRFKEIESKADADGLRELFDDICGKEVGELSSKIDSCVKALIDQSSAVIEKARTIATLTKDGAPLRKYAALLLEYHQANKPEVQSHYEALDKIEIAGKAAKSFVDEWEAIQEKLGIGGARYSIESFFNRLASKCYDESGNLLPYFNELEVLLKSDSVTPDIKKEIIDALSKIEGQLNIAQGILSGSHQTLQAKYQDEKDTLVGKGLPVGSKDREAKKSALDDAKSALTKYRSALTGYNETCSEREVLFLELQKHCKRRTELREQTAEKITTQLARDLENANLVVLAQAQAMADQKEFGKWLEKYIAPHIARLKPARIKALLEKENLIPSALRALLHGDNKKSDILSTSKASATDGLVTSDEAEEIFKKTRARERFDPEVLQEDVDETVWNDLPSEIKEGLWMFYDDDVAGQHKLKLHHVLELDQIVFDDIPVILLNDRPLDAGSKPRPLNQLSPGQRCSAILPILLLNGDSPLIIDQPEDNLDNSLIRQVIVNVLASIKLRRQVIVATHNPNLPVLGDAEQTIALKAIDENKSELEAHGNLDQSEIVGRITDIMEGGREAFQYRQTIYQQHWIGHVET
jgi:ABC-type lipoprotein export system ATPase subunit